MRTLRLIDLTKRRRAVAALVGLGLTRAEIARRLCDSTGVPISIRTVDTHVQAIAGLLPNGELPAYRRVKLWVRSLSGSDGD